MLMLVASLCAIGVGLVVIMAYQDKGRNKKRRNKR